MLQLDPKDIETILALSREFSLTAAGQRLGISRSAVSQRLDKIEAKIDCTIATRKGRLLLTAEGREIAEQCAALQQAFTNLHNRLQRIKDPQLTIMGDEVLLKCDLSEVIAQMLDSNPGLKIDLRRGTFSEIIRNVMDGTIDAGLIAGNPHVPGLRLVKYRIERVCLMIPKSHPLAGRREIFFEEAIHWPMVHSESLEHIAQIIDDMANKLNIKLIRPITCPSFDVQAHYVATCNNVIALTLESVARLYQPHHPITITRLRDDWAENQLYLCLREIGGNSKTTTDLTKLIVAQHTQTHK